MINNELVENIPLDKEGCLQIIHQSEELGYGWCVALDDTKDVYMTDDKFLRQVGKRKEPTRYIIDDMLDIDSRRDLQDLCSYSKRGRRETYKERVDRAFEI